MSHASLSITGIDPDLENEQEDFGRTQIVNFIKTCPDLTVRPADLSKEFGFSINDASAELCGLLQIVGQGAAFHFEDVNTIGDRNGGSRVVKSMVFKFPANFDRKVVNADRHDALKAWIKICVKALKVVTAFGLIVSILIVSVAILVALVAVLVALSNRGGESRAVSRKLRSLISTIRQLLFCYAMFGSVIENDTGQNSFFREAAYDALLMMNFCYSNPGSIFFWWRAGRIRQRWRRRASSRGSFNGFRNRNHDDSEDENLINEDNTTSITHQGSSFQQRNLISSLVMFLFGPTAPTGMSNADKWRLRSAVIIDKTSTDDGSLCPISLQELAPYTDTPPSSLKDTFRVIAEGLSIVVYFNGVPFSKFTEDGTTIQDQEDSGPNALFEFPELISESDVGVRYNDPRVWGNDGEDAKQGWDNFFYESNSRPSNESGSNSTRSRRTSSAKRTNSIPEYLYEQPKTFSCLSRNHFFSCLLLVVLNYLGVIWFSRSLESGGILEQNLGGFGSFLKAGLVPVVLRKVVRCYSNRTSFFRHVSQQAFQATKRKEEIHSIATPEIEFSIHFYIFILFDSTC